MNFNLEHLKPEDVGAANGGIADGVKSIIANIFKDNGKRAPKPYRNEMWPDRENPTSID